MIPFKDKQKRSMMPKKFKSIAALALINLFSICSFAQQESTVVYLDQMFKMTSNSSAPFKLELKKIAGDTYSGLVTDYLGTIKSKGTYIMVAKRYLEDGHFTYYFQNGQIESEGEFDRGVKVGSWKRFDQNGKRKADKYYPAESAEKVREAMMMEKEE
jgi:hypothetical protein